MFIRSLEANQEAAFHGNVIEIRVVPEVFYQIAG